MAGLYKACKYFVSATYGEGFGLPQAEAGLHGLHVCSPCSTGLSEFLNAGNCWAVDTEPFIAPEGCGVYAGLMLYKPDVESLQEQMRLMVYTDEPHSSCPLQRRIEQLTWKRTAEIVASHLL